MTTQAEIKGRILVVDDLLPWRKVVTAVLGTEYQVTAVGTYKEAVDAVSHEDFDVAVLDVRLQDMDTLNVEGIALLRMIREIKSDVGIVVLTGHRESVPELALKELEKYEPFELMRKEVFDNIQFKETIRKLVARSKDQKGRSLASVVYAEDDCASNA